MVNRLVVSFRRQWRLMDPLDRIVTLLVIFATTMLTVLLLFSLTGCGQGYSGDGVIVQRMYDDPDTYEMYHSGTSICSGKGMNRTCVSTPGWWSTEHDGPHWSLKVRDAKAKTHTVSVSEAEYDRCSVGNLWSGSNRSCTPQ